MLVIDSGLTIWVNESVKFKEKFNHSYDSQVIFTNSAFNTHVGIIILMGLISLGLSYSPDIFQGFERCLEAVKR